MAKAVKKGKKVSVKAKNAKKTKRKPTKTKKALEKEAKKGMKYPHIFELYRAWLIIPVFLKGKDDKQLEALGVNIQTELVEIIRLKNKKAFAKHFKITQKTVWEWDKKIDLYKLDKSKGRSWVVQATENILYSLYRNAVKHADAHRVKLWLQYIEGWREGQDITSGGEAIRPVILPERDAVKDEL